MTTRAMAPEASSTLGGVLAIVLWSTTVALVRSLSERVGPLTAGAAVYLAGAVVCFGWTHWGGGGLRCLRTLPRRYVAGCGGLFAGYTVMLFLAVGVARDRAQVLEVGLVNYLWPPLTVLLSLPVLGQRANLWLVPGTLCAVFGLVWVMTPGGHFTVGSFLSHVRGNPLAYGLAAAAACAWALYSNLARRWGPRDGGAVGLFMAASGMLLAGLRWLSSESGSWDVRAVGEAAFLGVVTALAYALWDRAMRRGHLTLVAAVSYLTPLLSTLVSCLYLGVGATWRLAVGCLALVVGSLVSWWSTQPRGPAIAAGAEPTSGGPG